MSEKPALDVYRPAQLHQASFSSFGMVEKPASKREACPSAIVEGRMVILKKWHPRPNLSKDSYTKISVWAKLFNIPHEYWNEEGLSHIASAVGKPLYADSLTESMK
ncbi:hypothetical protein Ddye_008112 [Dipteronia dyeriana]|uniref:DUF4283 domain-containing protein n=1 Tax=Dipteronia dyeriana TaxID=168575 RepID=A0AAE0CL04_9ROSI|nr:hypothetical protein Ddye_008112 [Dipteronia dyeriana]